MAYFLNMLISELYWLFYTKILHKWFIKVFDWLFYTMLLVKYASFFVNWAWLLLLRNAGILLTVVVIEFIGRKKTMAMEFVIFGVTITTLLMLCITSRTVLTVILFISRGVISGVFQAAYVYTPEVYPTHLRSVGVGVCSTMARLGAMVTPFVAQVPISSIFIHSNFLDSTQLNSDFVSQK